MNKMDVRYTRRVLWIAIVAMPSVVCGQTFDGKTPNADVLSADEWKKVDDSVDRGLAWLASQQRDDGSFPSIDSGQPAVTSLAVMAFLARGHCPGTRPYGSVLDRAIDFVVTQQQSGGLLSGGSTAMAVTEWNMGSHTATYNHAIAGLMLGEVFGMSDARRTEKLQPAIEKAIVFARRMQRRPTPHRLDTYGWRYFKHQHIAGKGEADLSVTGWYVMFYRSARNAGFDIPQEYVDEAVQFVRTCYVPQEGGFVYGPYTRDRKISRGTTGAGLLCLTLSGNHDDIIAQAAGRWMVQHPFTKYNYHATNSDRYHYGAYYASQAMFMLGGEQWKKFYPPLAATMVGNQAADGSWQPESAENDAIFGNCYTTSLVILALSPPYQLLPIYQR
jgi:hypothetical protein